MKRVLWLVSVYLLGTVLLLNSCTQNAPDAPPAPAAEQPSTSALVPESPSVATPIPTTTPTPSSKAIPATPDDSWGPWGPLKWADEYKATKGAYLDFVEKEELTIDGKPAIIYFLVAAGLSQDKTYHLWVKSLSNPTPTELSAETQIDDSGYLIKGGSRFQMGVQAPAKGEAMEFALMNADKTGGAFGKVIAYPIESKQGPYRLWVELRSKKGDTFIIYGEGFEPNEEVDFTSNSEGEVAKGKIKADDNGRLTTIVLPAVVGKESGLATFTVLGKQSEVKVSFAWGVAAMKAAPLVTTPPTPTTTAPGQPKPLSPPVPTQTRPLPPLDAFMKGITYADWISYDAPRERWGLYRPPEADPSLRNLALTGANWIGLIVVAGQETIASTKIFHTQPRTATDSELRHVVDLAHSLGIRVMLRAGVGLSKDPSHWSADIGSVFTNETQWQEWFASYREYINHFATFSQEAGVDMLCIGIEMGGVTHREQDWRRVIKEVRERFKGPITYSSLSTQSWGLPHGEENRIKWWDAVDYIGVSAYYELTKKNDPTVEEIKAAWTDRGHIALLENLSRRFNKPIIFTEIGYPSYDGGNKLPAGHREAPIDLQEQADCYQAALEVMLEKPWMRGIFWFQWQANNFAPTGPTDTGLTPRGKPAEEVLKRYYLGKQ